MEIETSSLKKLKNMKINTIETLDPLGDGISKLELIGYLGDDLSVVNDAKASFEKEATSLSVKEIKLINYLVKHNHTSPFRGVVFKFKVKAPLFVCRQWWKHVIASNHNDEQLGWNEKSLRYVSISNSNDFYVPTLFRKQSPTNKQAGIELINIEHMSKACDIYSSACLSAYEAYKDLIDMGVCREQARGVLPPSVYTSWVWTVSLQAVLNFLVLRDGEGAQEEIRQYARGVYDLIKTIVPHSCAAFVAKNNKENL